jgi:hypothetical protein
LKRLPNASSQTPSFPLLPSKNQEKTHPQAFGSIEKNQTRPISSSLDPPEQDDDVETPSVSFDQIQEKRESDHERLSKKENDQKESVSSIPMQYESFPSNESLEEDGSFLSNKYAYKTPGIETKQTLEQKANDDDESDGGGGGGEQNTLESNGEQEKQQQNENVLNEKSVNEKQETDKGLNEKSDEERDETPPSLPEQDGSFSNSQTQRIDPFSFHVAPQNASSSHKETPRTSLMKRIATNVNSHSSVRQVHKTSTGVMKRF